MHPCRSYYCIAMALELWFERLDLDAFEQAGPVCCHSTSQGHLPEGGIVRHSLPSGGNARGNFIKERERHEDVEGPNRPSVAGLGGGRHRISGLRNGICRIGPTGAVGVQAAGLGDRGDGLYYLVS